MKGLIRFLELSFLLLGLCNLLFSQTAQYSVANYVQVIGSQNLVVRSSAGGTSVGAQAPGSQGKIIGGPTTASYGVVSYVWYNVDWQSGSDGWSVQNGMGLMTPSAPTLSSPGSASSPGPAMSSSMLTFTWNGSSSTTYYLLYLRDVTTDGLTQYSINAPTTSSTQTLIAGHNYRWNMQAFNGTSSSPFSGTYYGAAEVLLLDCYAKQDEI